MHWKFIAAALVLVSFGASAAPKCKNFPLGSGVAVKVPDSELWRIQGTEPYGSETGVGTADFYVKSGYVTIGEYTISGELEITINRKQAKPIDIAPGSIVQVGDSREQLNICVLPP